MYPAVVFLRGFALRAQKLALEIPDVCQPVGRAKIMGTA